MPKYFLATHTFDMDEIGPNMVQLEPPCEDYRYTLINTLEVGSISSVVTILTVWRRESLVDLAAFNRKRQEQDDE